MFVRFVLKCTLKLINKFNMKEKIDTMLAQFPTTEKIAILESLCKKYRRLNSVKINARQMGRKVDDDRPDLQLLKNQ